MRERITISKPSSYSKSSSGQITSGGTTTEGTYYANVKKGFFGGKGGVTQELTNNQNVFEESYSFEIRTQEDKTWTKEHTITWNAGIYQIVNISNQERYQKFTKFIAINVS